MDSAYTAGPRGAQPRLWRAGRLGWLGSLKAERPSNPNISKKEGCGLIWNTCIEMRPIMGANEGIFTIHPAKNSAVGLSRFPPTYHHLIDHSLSSCIHSVRLCAKILEI